MVVMCESSRQDEPRIWWKEAIKRRIAGLYSAALVGGQRHVQYLVELGMPRERIFTGYDLVDNHYFRQKAEQVRSQRSSASANQPSHKATEVSGGAAWRGGGSKKLPLLQTNHFHAP